MEKYALAPTDAGRTRLLFEPTVDIYDYAEVMLMRIDLPGVFAENLRITVDERLLHIRASVLLPIPPTARLVFQQFRIGDFDRTFILTNEILTDRILANLDRGVLTIQLPKDESLKSPVVEV